MDSSSLPRWRKRLEKELAFLDDFSGLDEVGWRRILRTRRVTSSNHDTALSIDWPHFCAHATKSCGGPQGWCYTFQGNQASRLHNRHVAMVDVLARKFPLLFADKVESEVSQAVAEGLMEYPNLRYSGSGELTQSHVPALKEVSQRGVRLWGFTRDLRLAKQLKMIGAAVIVSCDRTSPQGFAEQAVTEGNPIAYTSAGVDDHPPVGTIVTFPVHRIGRVREVVDTASLCPKVLADFYSDTRPARACQRFCQRCHLRDKS